MRYFSVTVRYSKNHIWIKYDTKTNIGKLGLTHFAQKDIGDIKNIKMPTVGQDFQPNSLMAKLESSKSIFNFLSPIPLRLKSVNEELVDCPREINANAEETHLFSAQVLDQRQITNLMSEEQYKSYLKKSGLDNSISKKPDRQVEDLEEDDDTEEINSNESK